MWSQPVLSTLVVVVSDLFSILKLSFRSRTALLAENLFLRKQLAFYAAACAPGGKIVTSPVLSEDGTKIAFVESVGTSAIFHVLTWTAGQGTLQSAAAPSAMASLTYSMSSKDTTSSPWIDYDLDTVYVGADKGLIYKITGVFHGTPTIAGAPWPVTVSTNSRVTSPVFDAALNVLMVGSANGILYKVNTPDGCAE